MTRIAILGAGYVGVTTAVAFAEKGHPVVLVDTDPQKVASLEKGQVPFYEPGLSAACAKMRRAETIKVTGDASSVVLNAGFAFLCVGTPSREDGSIDTSYVKAAAADLGRAWRAPKGYPVAVVKSTVIPGTTEEIVIPALESASGRRAGSDFGVCANPEFLQEGLALKGARRPDRIVIGANDARARRRVRDLYRGFPGRRLETDLRTAEMIKYATNAFLATKISFANELANLCDAFGGLDVDRVVEGMALDPRINPRFLKAGLGFGGSCLPKDVRAFVAGGKAHGYASRLLHATLQVNEFQPMRAIELAERAVGSLQGKRVAILGLAFKGNSDDIRESRAIPLARGLLERGATVVGYDPAANEAFRRSVPEAIVAKDVGSALADADVCIVHNDWPPWRSLRAADFSGMRRKVVVDGRRILRRGAMAGVELIVIGG